MRLFERFSEVPLLGNLDALLSRAPVGGADFSMLVSEHEGFDKTKGLVNRSSNLVVVHQHTTDLALWADDEKSSEKAQIN